jgi:hypothetical protein
MSVQHDDPWRRVWGARADFNRRGDAGTAIFAFVFQGIGMQEPIVIAERFRGPPKSGNGGYVCGAFAELLTGGVHAPENEMAAEVTLRAPVPLDTPLAVRRGADDLSITHGDTLIAEARLTELILDIPDPPGFDEARAVQELSPSFIRSSSRWFTDRIGFHPICFCCGAEHEDGMHVYAGPLHANELVAAAWPTQAKWADAEGNIPNRYLWTALDCPGQYAFYFGGIRTGMLGRLAARIVRTVRAGERCVVTGWRIAVEGRRHFAGTAVFNERSELCGYAKAVWVGRRNPIEPSQAAE